MKRKKYSNSLKTEVALAAIKAQGTSNEIASEFGVHISQVNRWKKQAIEALPAVFGGNQDKTIKEMEVERDRLFQQIGKLQVELDWLKKAPGIWDESGPKTWLY
jgi:transposase